MTKTIDNPMDFYKNKLKKIIFSNTGDDCSDYVSALSLFLSSGDLDYKYNVTYLKRENEKFYQFIKLCSDKVDDIVLIKDILKGIFVSKNIDIDDIFIIVDDFWTIGLNEDAPDILEEYSFDSAKTSIKYSLVTLYCKNKRDTKITFNLKDYKKNDFRDEITRIIEKVWI